MAAKRLTKSQVIAELAEVTELDKKSVNRVFEGLGEVIKKQLGARGPGEFVIPGLLKLKAVKKPATKDRPGKNPFTGEAMIIKGKPASKKIRATALKSLKDMIQLSPCSGRPLRVRSSGDDLTRSSRGGRVAVEVEKGPVERRDLFRLSSFVFVRRRSSSFAGQSSNAPR